LFFVSPVVSVEINAVYENATEHNYVQTIFYQRRRFFIKKSFDVERFGVVLKSALQVANDKCHIPL